MTAVFLKLSEAREVMGYRFGWEVAGGTCCLIVMAIVAFGATAALSPSATEPVPVSSHSGNGRLSQGEQS